MIDIKELRIGNLIDKNGIAARIEVINNEIDEVYFIADDFYNRDFCCNIKPIPLTEEWLLKFGYELQKSGTFLAPNSGNFIWFNKDLSECEIAGEYIMQHIKHVHQLQNLYFALTNKELTIK